MLQQHNALSETEGKDYSEEPARLRNTGFSLCVGCGAAITDQFILRVQPDMEWHARCLKCVKCDRHLDERSTCFVREGRTYCREDYRKLFILRCAFCSQAFTRSDYVMKAKNRTYHMECFRCVVCHRILQTGEEFALREDGLFCMNDHEKVHQASSPGSNIPSSDSKQPSLFGPGDDCLSPRPTSPTSLARGPHHLSESGLSSGEGGLTLLSASSPEDKTAGDSSLEISSDALLRNNNNNNLIKSSIFDDKMQDSPVSLGSDDDDASQDGSSICGDASLGDGASSTNGGATTGGSVGGEGQGGISGGLGGGKIGKSGKRSKEQKTTRVRTVLNEKQLHTLRTCYGANPRPDALMKEQLVEMTGLSPRVIRVWFQNKRCKDKKRQIMLKQMEHQHQNGSIQRSLQGIPMIASSPIRNDPNINNGTQIEVQQLSGPWKTEFGPLGPDMPPDQPPAFQQLMNTFEMGPDSGYFVPRSLCPPPPPHHGKSHLSGIGMPPPSDSSYCSSMHGGPPPMQAGDEVFRTGFLPSSSCPSPHYSVSPGMMAIAGYSRT